MSETPDALRDLLARAREDGPSPERLRRVRGRLESQLGPLDTPRASPPWRGSKVGLGLVGALAVGALYAWLSTAAGRTAPTVVPPHPEAPAVTVAEPVVVPEPAVAPPVSAERVEPLTAPVETETFPPRRATHAAPTPVTSAETAPSEALPAADAASSLREEIALLDRALRAREAGDLAGARAALEAHHARFPAGTLSPERDRMLTELAHSTDAPPVQPPAPATP